MKKPNRRGPRFVRFFGPLLEALRKLGGTGMPEDVKNEIVDNLGIGETELLETLASGQGRISNSIDWARFYLTKAGFIDGSKRGTWILTDRGWAANVSAPAALELFEKVHRQYRAARKRAAGKPRVTEKVRQHNLEVLPMPRQVARRIMVRCAKGEKVMVVVTKNGKPMSIHGLEEYLKKRQLRLQTDRSSAARPSDALPKIKADVAMPLKRQHYYD